MRRTWIVTVVLALAASIAAADPASDTDAATAKLAKDTKDRAALVATKATVAKRYDGELAAVDRLKQGKSSWRRDRQLQDAQAKALDTSNELAKLSGKITSLDAKITADKQAVVGAIDAELPKLGDGARKQQLVAARKAAAPPAATKAHKIIVPDAEIDPLADPEELDQQAAAIKASESELDKKVQELDEQARKLQKAADLRKAHDRAGDLAVRDDDQPRRTGTGGSGRTGIEGAHSADDGDPAPSENPGDGPAPPPAGGDLSGFMGDETAQVLSDVIDPATGEALRRANRGSDPATKAEAAKAARDQVKARLEALRKKRAAVEARAKALRTK